MELDQSLVGEARLEGLWRAVEQMTERIKQLENELRAIREMIEDNDVR